MEKISLGVLCFCVFASSVFADVTIQENGSTRGRIGNLNIVGAPVTRTGQTGTVTVSGSANSGWTDSGANVSTINSTDNVGIGTLTPTDSLQVVGGSVRAAGYKSSDGTAGATVTTCSSFKNGLCVAGT